MATLDRRDRIVHGGADPLWRQVADDIAADVDSGALPTGARLESEAVLAEIYGVARGTVRRAILDLTQRGLVTTSHGLGTFVV